MMDRLDELQPKIDEFHLRELEKKRDFVNELSSVYAKYMPSIANIKYKANVAKDNPKNISEFVLINWDGVQKMI